MLPSDSGDSRLLSPYFSFQIYVSLWINKLANTQPNDHAYDWASFRSWDSLGSHVQNKEQIYLVANNGANSIRPHYRIKFFVIGSVLFFSLIKLSYRLTWRFSIGLMVKVMVWQWCGYASVICFLQYCIFFITFDESLPQDLEFMNGFWILEFE